MHAPTEIATWLRRLIELRRRPEHEVLCYAVCMLVALFFALLGVGMEDDWIAGVPYVVVAALCLLQCIRPTVLVWSLLLLAFGSYTIAMALSFSQPAGEWRFFLACGGIPTVALLCAWPRPRPGSNRESGEQLEGSR